MIFLQAPLPFFLTYISPSAAIGMYTLSEIVALFLRPERKKKMRKAKGEKSCACQERNMQLG